MAASMLSLIVAALLPLGGDALLAAPYRQQAQDIRRMMEGVRMETENTMDTTRSTAAAPVGRPQMALSKTSQEVILAEGQLDTSLMRSADRIEQDMQTMRANEASQKRAALTSQNQETQRERAARYFETHGFNKVNVILGLHAAKGSATPLKPSAEEMHEDAEDDEDYHKRWAAADALRMKRPAAVA
mmetsp:Transcript_76461/g.151283  ORF Transcript_76461/g.151283 Transcript_76461/m.151283 type:complete len:187 (-) Transcript_76461:70-630(-)|eukprot:CAMPEP_0172719678 /NCGR_PEP_ID=MMETSP1074-20121228/75647_1 /TAXON_ID=2916 /ORGANISM="Ceratium fusus, Strain PA161109" /LENGTH=186 /DNA_ID=CAMNT_0013545063 /DNA_START=77 /DNA_END=637 /DNA_ORIENTATION=-